jgi:hypothetical protein
VIGAQQASRLLDDVIYERVLAFVDLAALHRFELELWCSLGECGVADAEIADLAKQLIDRALARIPDDPRRYMDLRSEWPAECELCDEEAAACARTPKRAKHRA